LAEHLSDEALTAREIEVLIELAGGNRNREIAERLFITEETVKVVDSIGGCNTSPQSKCNSFKG